MSATAVYLKSIGEVYPDFVIEKVHPSHREGQFNDIVIINDDLIFRFPKYDEGISDLVTEIRLLQFLQNYLSLPIPNPVYINIDTEKASKTFMGYRIILGEPLWRETLATIPDEQTLQRLADQLGNFLKELHTIPVDKIAEDLPVKDGFDEWANMYSEFRQNLYQFMRPDAQAQVTNHFDTFFRNSSLHTFKPCLRHGDFGPSNILYSKEIRAISGIIDFDEMGLGDPAIDIASVSCFGEKIFSRLRPTYPEIDSLLERAQFYKGTYALQEALHGFKNNDQEAFESGIAEYV